MTPEQDLDEVIWLAAFGHLEQVHAGVRASDLRATVLGIIRALEASGLAVVSAEDLQAAEDALTASEDTCGSAKCEQTICQRIARLRAALPESPSRALLDELTVDSIDAGTYTKPTAFFEGNPTDG